MSAKRRWPHAFCFGSLQTVFRRCRLLQSMLIPAWHGQLELPGPGQGELRTVASRITESAMTAALAEARCRWEVLEYENLTGQRTLQTEPVQDVRVSFVFTDRESYDSPPFGDGS